MTQLKIDHVTKSIDGRNILRIDNLIFKNNGIYGLVGPNGAGKTTLLKCVCGLLVPNAGDIRIDDLILNQETRTDFLKKIGSVFAQSDSIFDLSIKELLEEHYYFFGLTAPKKWSTILENVGLDVSEKQMIGSLSLGMRQRLLLAVAISHTPEILILDEPFNGLDPDGVVLTKNLIEQLSQDKIVIITSHSFADLNDVITDAIVMAKGQTSTRKTIAEINEEFSDGLMGFYHSFINSVQSLN
ncbi:ABC transporter ATP-binding protein [Secundilactobacillus kimchicus JCM 15530]|uniref:ABC transporter ATP-binding protein n=1 Tax=Secundilactobacillus kimchicus JCM 15530 TaxID=1302272 RepID=A0A0R1HV81_9LACO|nr:ABC transporter ATP-binding protein [Secundilactobacillus kimchicus]KRK48467.1 ABC transporter ATP-binding protein [Secundilactobacillus kimchicus JCM 15530]